MNSSFKKAKILIFFGLLIAGLTQLNTSTASTSLVTQICNDGNTYSCCYNEQWGSLQGADLWVLGYNSCGAGGSGTYNDQHCGKQTGIFNSNNTCASPIATHKPVTTTCNDGKAYTCCYYNQQGMDGGIDLWVLGYNSCSTAGSGTYNDQNCNKQTGIFNAANTCASVIAPTTTH